MQRLLSMLTLSCVATLGVICAAGESPNIILIMADDLGFSDIGCYGGEIRTPNLDRLATEGLRLTQFYNNGKCTPTRASLLSGMYPRGQGKSIPLEIPSIGEAMRAAGYQTGLSGKWHLGSKTPQRPIDRGFDEFFGLMDGCCNFFNPAQPDPESEGGRVRVFGHNDTLIQEFPKDFYTTDAFATHARETIKRFHQVGRPFFIHLAFTAPHYPLHAPPEDIARYRGKYKLGWEAMRRQRHARQIDLGIVDPKWQLSETDSQAYDWQTANHDWEDLRMATYAAMVDRMDQNIGKVLATLEDLNISENTLVMFLSDNGGCAEEPGGRDDKQEPGPAGSYMAVGPAWGWAQNTPFRRYKSWMNEGGISTPFIVRWPGKVPAGAISAQVGHIIDILPTCLELAGASYPQQTSSGKPTAPVEGRSLLPVLRGGQREAHDTLVWEWSGNSAVRQGDWKLVWDRSNPAERWQLYNVNEDRTELNDVANQYPSRVTSMRSAYKTWIAATQRVSPREAANPKP